MKPLKLILAALAAAVSLSAAAEKAASPAAKSVVLVHGAFADGSSWDAVVPLLQAKG